MHFVTSSCKKKKKKTICVSKNLKVAVQISLTTVSKWRYTHSMKEEGKGRVGLSFVDTVVPLLLFKNLYE